MVLTYLILCRICMSFIDVESSRSWITCIMVVAESDWMRIQKLPNIIGCGVKKNRVRTPLLQTRIFSFQKQKQFNIRFENTFISQMLSKLKHVRFKKILLSFRKHFYFCFGNTSYNKSKNIASVLWFRAEMSGLSYFPIQIQT